MKLFKKKEKDEFDIAKQRAYEKEKLKVMELEGKAKARRSYEFKQNLKKGIRSVGKELARKSTPAPTQRTKYVYVKTQRPTSKRVVRRPKSKKKKSYKSYKRKPKRPRKKSGIAIEMEDYPRFF